MLACSLHLQSLAEWDFHVRPKSTLQGSALDISGHGHPHKKADVRASNFRFSAPQVFTVHLGEDGQRFSAKDCIFGLFLVTIRTEIITNEPLARINCWLFLCNFYVNFK